MSLVQKLVTAASFDARGVYVPAGHIGTFDTDKLSGKEKHLKDVDGFAPAVVQIAPIAPTGPNPKAPQQVPPGAVQTAAGMYAEPGKVLVGAKAPPSKEARAVLTEPSYEGEVNDQLADIMADPTAPGAATTEATAGGPGSTTGNADDNLVEGTVAEITANLGTQTDEQLEAMRAAERDRERPRKGVLDAIADELDGRKKAK